MIKKLQHRFILITMSCIGFIFLLILLILNISKCKSLHFDVSDTKGIVTISLTKSADKKLLFVHNTGNGIDKKDLKHIFERFYRIDSSRSRQSGGYGLGLSIAESIVKNHRGQISVKSDGKSHTDFYILLP